MHIDRRTWLRQATSGVGTMALASLLAETDAADLSTSLATKRGHHAATADRVIFFYSTGGVSHVDTWDYKPQLYADHGKTLSVSSILKKPEAAPHYFTQPMRTFRRYGNSGVWVSDLFPHLGSVVDELCVLNAMHGDSNGHDKGTLAAHTGSAQFARPSHGAWVSYGLGTLNQNLPSFIVLAPHAPYAGAQTWGSDFLPGCHQGTRVAASKTPLPYLQPLTDSPRVQRLEMTLRAAINRDHLQHHAAEDALEARIQSFETAFKMQSEAPQAFDLSEETEETLKLYGVDRGAPDGFGWQCLVARRLAERGVRFIELIDSGSSDNWDSHGSMAGHEPRARVVDQPMAALITDLKRRGMLDRTLVVWTTEFGRTPFHATANHPGREHHNLVFSSWLAGGGVQGGIVHGRSDEHGLLPVEHAVHTHDLHATMLHCLGLDHERLTYRHAGRDYRLTDVAGRVVQETLVDA